MTVIEEIAAERKRQIEAEGWTTGHDDEHDLGEMALAASCYAECATDENYDFAVVGSNPPAIWPWGNNWWKPKSRRRDLIRAAALIVAEIERLDRAAMSEKGGGQ